MHLGISPDWALSQGCAFSTDKGRFWNWQTTFYIRMATNKGDRLCARNIISEDHRQGLCAWNIDRLIEQSRDLVSEHVPLSAIRELDESFWANERVATTDVSRDR